MIGSLLLFLLVAAAFTLLFRPIYHQAMMPYYDGGSPFFFPFGFLFFFLIVILLGRLLFAPWGRGWRQGGPYHRDEATDILRSRYAKGEITKEQFDQMTRDLKLGK